MRSRLLHSAVGLHFCASVLKTVFDASIWLHAGLAHHALPLAFDLAFVAARLAAHAWRRDAAAQAWMARMWCAYCAVSLGYILAFWGDVFTALSVTGDSLGCLYAPALGLGFGMMHGSFGLPFPHKVALGAIGVAAIALLALAIPDDSPGAELAPTLLRVAAASVAVGAVGMHSLE